MSELTIETYLWCPQNEEFQTTAKGSTGDTYSVSFGRGNPGEYGANWHCTCPGFKHRKTCKHVTQASLVRCTHGYGAIAGDPSDDWVDGRYCPECGSEATPIRVAV